MHRNISASVLIFVNVAEHLLGLDQNQLCGTACHVVERAEMQTRTQDAVRQSGEAKGESFITVQNINTKM